MRFGENEQVKTKKQKMFATRIQKFEESVKIEDKKVTLSKTCVEGTHENLHETLDCVEMQYVLSLEYVNCYYNNKEYPATVDVLKEISIILDLR